MVENHEEKPKKKIIVDEDWKSQVQAEKEAFKQQTDQQAAAPTEQQEAEAQRARGPESAEQVQVPPASFSVLVTSLATQAMVAMGQMADPKQEGSPAVQRDLAKHYIDTLGILEQKTQGNLSVDESTMLGNVLHELRMMFVSVTSSPSGGTREG